MMPCYLVVTYLDLATLSNLHMAIHLSIQLKIRIVGFSPFSLNFIEAGAELHFQMEELEGDTALMEAASNDHF